MAKLEHHQSKITMAPITVDAWHSVQSAARTEERHSRWRPAL